MVTMVPTGRGQEIVEVAPQVCPNGHRLEHPNVQVFYGVTPAGRRARGWRCWTCGEVIYEDDD